MAVEQRQQRDLLAGVTQRLCHFKSHETTKRPTPKQIRSFWNCLSNRIEINPGERFDGNVGRERIAFEGWRLKCVEWPLHTQSACERSVLQNRTAYGMNEKERRALSSGLEQKDRKSVV